MVNPGLELLSLARVIHFGLGALLPVYQSSWGSGRFHSFHASSCLALGLITSTLSSSFLPCPVPFPNDTGPENQDSKSSHPVPIELFLLSPLLKLIYKPRRTAIET